VELARKSLVGKSLARPDLVRQSNAGQAARPEDLEGLAAAFRQLHTMTKEQRAELSEAAKAFYQANLAEEVLLSRYEHLFEQLVRDRLAPSDDETLGRR
jgi:glycosyltransferase involved in cell wall biosynthesis